MLNVESIDVRYGAVQALREVSMEVPAGGYVSIIGANGAGKSTLLKAIAGVLHPVRGRIRLRGERVEKSSPRELVRKGVTLVPEGRQLFTSLAVEDNLLMGAYLHFRRRGRKAIEQRLGQIYALFPRLRDRARQQAGTLSGGEQQMVSIGRALMAEPELLMLDEPSMGLAPLVVKEIMRTIGSLNHQGVTIVLVEQNARAALTSCNRAYVLETGAVALEGPGPELLEDPRVIENYLGGE